MHPANLKIIAVLLEISHVSELISVRRETQ
jgi:hypothetical protein